MALLSTDNARRLDLECVRGMTTETLEFPFGDPSAGNPVDISSYVFDFEVWDADGNIIVDLTSTSNPVGIASNGAGGIAWPVMTSAQTWALSPAPDGRPYQYGLAVAIGGTRHCAFFGAFIVVTRPPAYP